MAFDRHFSSADLGTATDAGTLLPAQTRVAVGDRISPLSARRSIDLAFEQIAQRWRDTPRCQTLICELTALDWRARTLDDEHPVDEDLIHRIGALRSHIWLTPA